MPLFFVDCCILLDVLQPFKATTYFNFYNFCRLICRRHTVAKCHPPHVPPWSRNREPHPLVYCCFVFYWRPPNAWTPSPSLFSRYVAFRHPKQPPQRELNDIARARRRARCYELARRAGPGGGKRRGWNGRQRAMGGGVLFYFKMLPLRSPLQSFLSFRYAFVIPFCLFSTMCISITIKY